MTGRWKLPDGRVVDDRGLWLAINDIVDDRFFFDRLDEENESYVLLGREFRPSDVAKVMIPELTLRRFRRNIAEGYYFGREGNGPYPLSDLGISRVPSKSLNAKSGKPNGQFRKKGARR